MERVSDVGGSGSEELKKCLPLHSCYSWMFVKENPHKLKCIYGRIHLIQNLESICSMKHPFEVKYSLSLLEWFIHIIVRWRIHLLFTLLKWYIFHHITSTLKKIFQRFILSFSNNCYTRYSFFFTYLLQLSIIWKFIYLSARLIDLFTSITSLLFT